MSNDWWPAPLAHIPAEQPWAHDSVTVAEIKSFDEQPHAGHRRTFTALVPVDQIDALKMVFANFNHEVSTSGPHPFYVADRPFKPAFWLGGGRACQAKNMSPWSLLGGRITARCCNQIPASL